MRDQLRDALGATSPLWLPALLILLLGGCAPTAPVPALEAPLQGAEKAATASTAQPLLQSLAQVSAAGYTVLRQQEEVVTWRLEGGTASWPDSTLGLLFLTVIEVPARVLPDGTIPNTYRFVYPADTRGGVVMVAAVVGQDTTDFGREVDLLTGELVGRAHYGERPVDWLVVREEP